ncbi:hypothetical protein [Acidovorax sp.]|uniref:hypothetical protein n=1 Tax=Acidovorax sp. TaxID=1872122 RepID=UPI0039198942
MTTTTDPFASPVWASLCYAPALAEGDALARRYRRDIHLFASPATTAMRPAWQR